MFARGKSVSTPDRTRPCKGDLAGRTPQGSRESMVCAEARAANERAASAEMRTMMGCCKRREVVKTKSATQLPAGTRGISVKHTRTRESGEDFELSVVEPRVRGECEW
jgi:hypothetical protein